MNDTADTNIDVVIPWVDDEDAVWQEIRARYLSEFSESTDRLSHYFRNWDTLRYVLRSIETNMPWVRQVHILTCGQVPSWLNTAHPKLRLHTHAEFFSPDSVLPVFSCNPIEMNLMNIPGLAEQFIYFNDDTLVMKPVTPQRFYQNGLPVDYLVLDFPRGGWLYDRIRIKDSYADICKNSIRLLNDVYPLRTLFRQRKDLVYHSTYKPSDLLRNHFLHFIGKYKWIKINHHPQAMLLSNLIKCLELFPAEMTHTARTRFRSHTDLNQYLYRNMALMSGHFQPHFYDDAFCMVLSGVKRYQKERRALSERTFVCVNDSPFLSEAEYPELKRLVEADLNRSLPRKSDYEL